MQLENKERLVNLYRDMVRLRQLDTKTCNMQKTGQIGTCATFAGHEAIDVGAATALKPTDVFVPYYRDQGILLSRGLEMSDILAFWSGNEIASNKSPNSDLPMCIPIGTQYTVATGAASALKYKKQKNVVLVTGGDASSNKGDLSEALNVASLWQLPIVFLIKNNQWAISTPSSRGTAGEIYKRAASYNMRGVRVDGTNVLEMFEACDEAFTRARQNKGPTLIEAVTYRLRPHTTVDADLNYRTIQEVNEAWIKYDPVEKFKKYIETNLNWSHEQEITLQEDIKKEIDEQLQKYNDYSISTVDDIFDYTYADSSHLNEQKQICSKYFTNSKEH